MTRAYIFDLDGTLVDGYEALAASLNFVRAAAGLPPLDVDTVRRMVGGGLKRLLTAGAPGIPLDAALELFYMHHPSVIRSGTKLLPEAREVVEQLSRRKRPMAVASNKPEIFTRRILGEFGMDRFFGEIVGPERAGAPKPDPAMVLLAARSLGVDPAAVVYVGDMLYDIRVARAAGARVWVVPTGGNTPEELRAAQPDAVLGRLSDLLDRDRDGDA